MIYLIDHLAILFLIEFCVIFQASFYLRLDPMKVNGSDYYLDFDFIANRFVRFMLLRIWMVISK